MCLLIFGVQTHPQIPLVMAANRDEFYRRPTAPATFWREHPEVLAGRDLEQGGTWMGLTRGGRFAAITNFRDPNGSAVAPRSRGELPLNFLTGQLSPRAYLETVAERADEYAGFNLLVGAAGHLWYLSSGRGQGAAPVALQPGVYGLSNAMLDTPWPKVELGKQRLRQLLAASRVDHPALLTVVNDRRTAAAAALRPLGLDAQMDQLLSAQFITAGAYGTRSSTTLWLDADNRARWCERSFNPAGDELGTVEEAFEICGWTQATGE